MQTQINPSSPPPYATTDMHLAAFLMAKGHVMDVLDHGQQREFRFPDGARTDADEFFRNALIPARLYAGAIRDIKSAIRRPSSTHANPNAQASDDPRRTR